MAVSFLTVPPKYSNLSVIIEVDRILSAPLLDVERPVHRAGCPCLAVPNLGSAPAGEPRLATTTGGSAAVRAEVIEADLGGSDLLGLVAAGVDRLEIRSDDRPGRDGRRVAPEELPLVLDVEDPPGQVGSAPSTARGAGSDSDHESQQPALGRPADSRRIAETGYRDHRTYRRQIYGATSQAAFPDLADVPGKSCKDDGIGRLFHGPDDPV
jgi:hypothetical protein